MVTITTPTKLVVYESNKNSGKTELLVAFVLVEDER